MAGPENVRICLVFDFKHCLDYTEFARFIAEEVNPGFVGDPDMTDS